MKNKREIVYKRKWLEFRNQSSKLDKVMLSLSFNNTLDFMVFPFKSFYIKALVKANM